jgi:hypothetical protein
MSSLHLRPLHTKATQTGWGRSGTGAGRSQDMLVWGCGRVRRSVEQTMILTERSHFTLSR